MIPFSRFIVENETSSKHYFDIDETLFAHDHSKLRVHVKDPSGRRVKTLTNQEFNSYELPAGHSYDFSEFRSSDVFGKSASPIRKMIAKMKAMKNNGANVEMLTARGDLDDKNKFAAHMKKYGIDITPGSGIHVRRAGNMQGKPADTKTTHIADAIQKEGLKEVHLYDDSIDNIKGMLKLKKQFPDVAFHGYHVQHDPETGEVDMTGYSSEKKSTPKLKKTKPSIFNEYFDKSQSIESNSKMSKENRASESEKNFANYLKYLYRSSAEERGSGEHGPLKFARPDDPTHLPNRLGIQQ